MSEGANSSSGLGKASGSCGFKRTKQIVNYANCNFNEVNNDWKPYSQERKLVRLEICQERDERFWTPRWNSLYSLCGKAKTTDTPSVRLISTVFAKFNGGRFRVYSRPRTRSYHVYVLL